MSNYNEFNKKNNNLSLRDLINECLKAEILYKKIYAFLQSTPDSSLVEDFLNANKLVNLSETINELLLAQAKMDLFYNNLTEPITDMVKSTRDFHNKHLAICLRDLFFKHKLNIPLKYEWLFTQ